MKIVAENIRQEDNSQYMDKQTIKRILIVLAGAAAVAAFFYLDLRQYLTLDYLKESQEHFRRLYDDNRFTVLGTYMAIYIVVTALSLPGAAIMTLAGGALFGLLVGTVL